MMNSFEKHKKGEFIKNIFSEHAMEMEKKLLLRQKKLTVVRRYMKIHFEKERLRAYHCSEFKSEDGKKIFGLGNAIVIFYLVKRIRLVMILNICKKNLPLAS